MPGQNEVTLPAAGITVKLSPRDQLKASKDAPRASPPAALAEHLPPHPASLELTKGRTIPMPMMGNDSAGCCYLVSVCKHASLFTGSYGKPVEWQTDAVLAAYERLSGGDNGLYTQQVMDYWESGLLGGPHRIADYAVLAVTDESFVRDMAAAFHGLQFTMAMPDRWLRIAAPGATFDYQRGDRPNPNNGHAVLISGYSERGYHVETWGFREPCYMPHSGLRACDPEFISVLSADQVKAGKAANGMTASELEAGWLDVTGRTADIGADPDDPPKPPDPPLPGDVLPVRVIDPVAVYFSLFAQQAAGGKGGPPGAWWDGLLDMVPDWMWEALLDWLRRRMQGRAS